MQEARIGIFTPREDKLSAWIDLVRSDGHQVRESATNMAELQKIVSAEAVASSVAIIDADFTGQAMPEAINEDGERVARALRSIKPDLFIVGVSPLPHMREVDVQVNPMDENFDELVLTHIREFEPSETA